VISSKPARRYQDIRDAISAIREYMKGLRGAQQLIAARGIAFDAVRMRLLEISEAASKLGAFAEVYEPDIAWRRIRSFGNYLRHDYDDMDLDALLRALNELDELDAACAREIDRLAQTK
jgi:uncharacterized protein with HEPN domain